MSAPAASVPQNIEAEESVLGAMLVAEPTLTRVIDEVKLNAGDFYLDKHAAIFTCVHDLYAASKPVDELSVTEALVQRNQIEEAGGKHYVSVLAATVPAAGNAKHYAEIVQQNSLLRRLLGAGQEIVESVHGRNGDALAGLTRLAVEKVQAVEAAASTKTLRVETLTALLEREPDEVPSVAGRYIVRGEITSWAARGGCGKTTLLRTVVAHGAAGRPFGSFDFTEPVDSLWFSGEGSAAFQRRKLRRAVDFFSLDTDAKDRIHIVAGGGACGLKLTRAEDVAQVRQAIGAIRPNVRELVVAFDPLWPFTGGDENSSEVMGATMDAIADLCSEFEIAAVVPHHASQSGRGLDAFRGHTCFEGAIATGLVLTSPEPGERMLEPVKVRHAETLDDLRTRYLDFDSNGEIYVERSITTTKRGALLELLTDGEWRKANDLADELGVSRSTVRETYITPAAERGEIDTQKGDHGALTVRLRDPEKCLLGAS